MSAHLKRALAAVITGHVPELNAFDSVLANRNKKYPEMVVAAISGTRGPFGCGRVGYDIRDVGDQLVAKGRLVEVQTNLRLTLSAPSDENRNGGEIVAVLAHQLTDLFEAISHDRQHYPFVDPDSGENQFVTGIRVTNSVDLPPDDSGEPFLHRKALSIRVVQQIPYERPVEHTIDRVGITNEGTNV